MVTEGTTTKITTKSFKMVFTEGKFSECKVFELTVVALSWKGVVVMNQEDQIIIWSSELSRPVIGPNTAKSCKTPHTESD